MIIPSSQSALDRRQPRGLVRRPPSCPSRCQPRSLPRTMGPVPSSWWDGRESQDGSDRSTSSSASYLAYSLGHVPNATRQRTAPNKSCTTACTWTRRRGRRGSRGRPGRRRRVQHEGGDWQRDRSFASPPTRGLIEGGIAVTPWRTRGHWWLTRGGRVCGSSDGLFVNRF